MGAARDVTAGTVWSCNSCILKAGQLSGTVEALSVTQRRVSFCLPGAGGGEAKAEDEKQKVLDRLHWHGCPQESGTAIGTG